MIDQFATFEISKELKKLGFNEPCFTSYTDRGELNSPFNFNDDEAKMLNDYTLFNELPESTRCVNTSLNSNYVAAPLWRQVIDWFRKEHQIVIGVTMHNNIKFQAILKAIKIIKNKK